MGLLDHTHALRAAALVCGLAWFGPVMGAGLGASQLPDSTAAAASSSEPFGLSTLPVYGGGLLAKWLKVAQRIDDEKVQLALCDGDRERCASEAALQFLAVVDSGRIRDGRARLGEINRAINLAIHPMSDLAQFGEIDVWSSPLVTFYRGAGDCEDYAIAKFVALGMAGIPAEDLRIVVLADTIQDEGHAVAAVRLDGRWLILDNRRMAMVEDDSVRNYRPLFVIDRDGVMKYSDAPLLSYWPDHTIIPAAGFNSTDLPGAIAASN
jgi:predicted transglutaminase-like cysteine proteinase